MLYCERIRIASRHIGILVLRLNRGLRHWHRTSKSLTYILQKIHRRLVSQFHWHTTNLNLFLTCRTKWMPWILTSNSLISLNPQPASATNQMQPECPRGKKAIYRRLSLIIFKKWRKGWTWHWTDFSGDTKDSSGNFNWTKEEHELNWTFDVDFILSALS
jgi:hypothetical protein